MSATDLNPIGEPPSRGARWCPRCRGWLESWQHQGRRRCESCGTALVRPMVRQPTPKPGELRPGIVAEFLDPRDREAQVGARTLAALKARLTRAG